MPVMTDRLFGTDGVRGVANTELSPALALALGSAAAQVLGRGAPAPTFVIGRDTRLSGTLLEAALSAGLCSQGAHVISPGIMPTPAVAHVVKTEGYSAGAVISASHNPYADNGIKFFGPDGYKLDDAAEDEIAALIPLSLNPRAPQPSCPSGTGVGRMERAPRLRDLYAHHLMEMMGDVRLTRMRLVIDGANGAAHALAPWVFSDLGAIVTAIHCAPDGTNINAGCGSLHTAEMQARTVSEGAALGMAFDGDADRVLFADETGRLVDGDRVMLLVGKHLAAQGLLPGGVVVGTIMSNMGLEVALNAAGLSLMRAPVGDRYVSEAMRAGGYALGGEKSGHILFGHLSTTGDGLLTALQVLKVLRETGKTLSELAGEMTDYPQVLLGVRVQDRTAWQHDAVIQQEIARAEARLAGRGRLNVRASGTEKLIRVMAEGPDQAEVEAVAGELAAVVKARVGE